jgi:hypothetical protein
MEIADSSAGIAADLRAETDWFRQSIAEVAVAFEHLAFVWYCHLESFLPRSPSTDQGHV